MNWESVLDGGKKYRLIKQLKMNSMVQKIINYGWIIFFSFTIAIHFLKIIYIYFKPTWLNKYEIILNTNISKYKLSLYYLLTIMVLIHILMEKFKYI